MFCWVAWRACARMCVRLTTVLFSLLPLCACGPAAAAGASALWTSDKFPLGGENRSRRLVFKCQFGKKKSKLLGHWPVFTFRPEHLAAVCGIYWKAFINPAGGKWHHYSKVIVLETESKIVIKKLVNRKSVFFFRLIKACLIWLVLVVCFCGQVPSRLEWQPVAMTKLAKGTVESPPAG